jgi:hypothetical protein
MLLVFFVSLFVSVCCLPSYSWLFNCTYNIPYAHNVILQHMEASKEFFPNAKSCDPQTNLCNLIAAVFQAGSTEGADMFLSYTRSFDLGESWEKTRVAVPSFGRSAWGPVMHYNQSTSTLWLFFALSLDPAQPAFSNPGGDLYYQISTDFGNTWGEAVSMYTQEGGVPVGQPKYLVNQLTVLASGALVMPYGSTQKGYPKTSGSAVRPE